VALLVVELPPALLSESQSHTSPTSTTKWRHLWGVPTSAVDLYVHSPIRLRAVVLSYLSTGTTLPLPLPLTSMYGSHGNVQRVRFEFLPRIIVRIT
jgi:hypothetical protein